MDRINRRHLLKTAAALSSVSLLHAFRPAWANQMKVRAPASGADAHQFNLNISPLQFTVGNRAGRAMSINGTIPGPLLEWQEGRDVVLNVTNSLPRDSSIHWHGILLPFEMDGVPGVTFKGIQPGSTFQYRFPVKQSGTYWYHSHSGLQEQSGVYGPLVIHPAVADDSVAYDRDYVVMLSDWTFEDPHRVLAKLKKMSDYYNFKQFSLAEFYGVDEMTPAQALQLKLAWDRMRMMPTDIADVTGATYTYLMNGLHPAANWTGLFQAGERVRLRFINGSAMSFFNIRIPQLPMTVIAADGQDVQPVETDELQIGVAETYDVIVEPGTLPAYTIMAESMDRSGYAAGTLAIRAGARASIPELRKRPLLTMVDMGMDMDMPMPMPMDKPMESGVSTPQGHVSLGSAADNKMTHAASDHRKMGHGKMDHSKMNHTAMGQKKPDMHAQHRGHDMGVAQDTGPIVARHGPEMHGPGNVGIAAVQRDRLGERGTGLAGPEISHRVLVYTDLQRRANDFDTRPPTREIELHLTGHMERYMWSFDGKQFHEVDGPIEFSLGERLRLILVNDTMMNHPIHLHGMWMELENGAGIRLPRKHTINIMPAARVSALINADAPGRWAFHCHLLYHMEMGMMRVVRVS